MNVVHFNCYKCGSPIVMGDKFWRKRAKCNQCGTVLIVPAMDVNLDEPSVPSNEEVPKTDLHSNRTFSSQIEYLQSNWIGITAMVSGVLIVVAMLTWVLFIRDTWELTRGSDWLVEYDHATKSYEVKHDSTVVDKFRELISEASPHRVTRSEITDALSSAHSTIAQFEAEQHREQEAKEAKDREQKRLVEAAESEARTQAYRSSGSNSTYSSSYDFEQGVKAQLDFKSANGRFMTGQEAQEYKMLKPLYDQQKKDEEMLKALRR